MNTAISNPAIEVIEEILGSTLRIDGANSFHKPLWFRMTDDEKKKVAASGIKIVEDYEAQDDDLCGERYTMTRYNYHIIQ